MLLLRLRSPQAAEARTSSPGATPGLLEWATSPEHGNTGPTPTHPEFSMMIRRQTLAIQAKIAARVRVTTTRSNGHL